MSKKPLKSEELTELTTGLNNWPAISGGPGIRKRRKCSRSSPRVAGKIFIHNAVAVLREVSDLTSCGCGWQDPSFATRVQGRAAGLRSVPERKIHLVPPKCATAPQEPGGLFSAEFGFHETLPIAAGGLGVLAGDHAKAASDLGARFRRHQPLLIAKVISTNL